MSMFNETGDVNAVVRAYLEKGTSPEVWYDWFCPDRQLKKRGLRLMNILVHLIAREKMDEKFLANKYVFFKNNCPVNGKTYDQLSICNKDSGEVLFVVQDQINEERGKGVWLWRVDVGFEDNQKTELFV